MTTNFCGCTFREVVVATCTEKYIYKQLRCKHCGRMFTETEKVIPKVDKYILNMIEKGC